MPQIAIPTVISADSGASTPSRRASAVPRSSATDTTTTMASTLTPPVSISWPSVNRAPSSVIPTRSANRAAGDAPARRAARTEAMLPIASPIASAMAVSSPSCSDVPDEPGDRRDAGTGQQAGQHRAGASQAPRRDRSGQSRTRGGLSRSNMWTVSTKPDLLGLVGHHERMRPCAATEEADALEQVAGGHPGRREHEVLARRQVLGRVDPVLVAVAHPRAAFPLLVVAVAEARLDLATEATQRGGRDDALRRAADAHDGVDAGARDRAGDGGRQVAVADELDARAGRPDLGDQVVVPRPLEDHDRDVADLAPSASAIRPRFSVGLTRMSTWPAATGPTHSFSRYVSGAWVEAARLRRGEDGDRARLAVGHEVRALQRVDGDVDRAGRPSRSAPVRPTRSPMYSIGASSRSPSPMTIRPANSISSIVLRIASVAAASASSRAPRPMNRADSIAAASVTRTISSASSCSISDGSGVDR